MLVILETAGEKVTHKADNLVIEALDVSLLNGGIMDILPSIILQIHYIVLLEHCQEHCAEPYKEPCKYFLCALFRKEVNGSFCPLDCGPGLCDQTRVATNQVLFLIT